MEPQFKASCDDLVLLEMNSSALFALINPCIYQFLCDEQEKLIYRCNRITGEIECYSNRNDKLKILSSVK